MGFDDIPPHPVLAAVGQQYAEGTVGVHHVVDVGNAHRHRLAIARGDLLKPRRAIEAAGQRLPNVEPHVGAPSPEVQDRSKTIRAVFGGESSAKPQAAILPADRGTRRIDRTAGAAREQAGTGCPGELGQRVDAQQRATEGAFAANAVGGRGNIGLAGIRAARLARHPGRVSARCRSASPWRRSTTAWICSSAAKWRAA